MPQDILADDYKPRDILADDYKPKDILADEPEKPKDILSPAFNAAVQPIKDVYQKIAPSVRTPLYIESEAERLRAKLESNADEMKTALPPVAPAKTPLQGATGTLKQIGETVSGNPSEVFRTGAEGVKGVISNIPTPGEVPIYAVGGLAAEAVTAPIEAMARKYGIKYLSPKMAKLLEGVVYREAGIPKAPPMPAEAPKPPIPVFKGDMTKGATLHAEEYGASIKNNPAQIKALEDSIPLEKDVFQAQFKREALDVAKGGEAGIKSPVEEFLSKKQAEPAPEPLRAPDQNTGIRQKTLARQYGTMPGEGTTPEVQIQRGRDLKAKGMDPEVVMQEFETTKKFNADSLDVARAHLEDLKAQTRQAATPEAQEAGFKAQEAWVKRLKPMATEWHKVGMGFQGETAPDTGSLVGIREAVIQKTGHDIKPAEIPQAKAIATTVSGLDKDIKAVQSKIQETIANQPELGMDIKPSAKLSKGLLKPGTSVKLTDKQKAIWKHAKDNYIDKGVGSFEDMLKGTAQDLGVSYKEVVDAIRAPKAAYKYTTEMYKLQSRRRAAVRNANSWIASRDATPLQKMWDTIYRIPFGIRVAGHAVGMETHAGISAFIPSDWAIYFPKVLEQFKNLVSSEFHERAMQELVNRDYYWDAKRGGLAVDPDLEADNFQIYAKWLGKLGEGGARAMDTLKSFRYEMFEKAWNQSAAEMRTPEYAKELSKLINHATGVADSKYGAAMGWMFAPKLELSRWVRLIGDPIKTIKYLNTADATVTPAQRQIGKLFLRRAGEFAGVYAASLALNDGLNMALGSKDRVNYTDPLKPDFLKHKIGGHPVDLTGGLMQPLRLLAHLAAIVAGPQPARGETRFNKAGEAVANYGRGKASPFNALLSDWAAQSDYEGRLLPWSKDKPKLGKPKYTLVEYALLQGPIPFAGAIRELADVWHAQGMTIPQMNDWLSALAVFGAESTGIKVGQSDKAAGSVAALKQAAEQGFESGDVSFNQKKRINKLSDDTELNKFNAMSLSAKSDILIGANSETIKKYWQPYILQYKKMADNPKAAIMEKGRNEFYKIVANHKKILSQLQSQK